MNFAQLFQAVAVATTLACLSHPAIASEDITPDAALAEAVGSIGVYGLDVGPGDGIPKLAYFASRRLDAAAADPRDANVLDAIVVIHGIRRDAAAYFETIQAAAQLAGQDTAGLLLVAPQFLSARDARVAGSGSKFLIWHGGAWSEGGEADGSGRAISAFAALDAIVDTLSNRQRYPQLRRIVVAGHSAGGQMVQRYAVANQIDDRIRKAGIALRYVVANPSTYLYLTSERAAAHGRFATPAPVGCADFDRYRYGLDRANRYVGAQSREQLIAAYAGRDVIYLVGGRDTDPNHPALDKQCPAELQGRHRLDRGLTYLAYLGHLYGGSIQETQRLFVVPQVGHDQTGMFTSPCGLRILFGPGSC